MRRSASICILAIALPFLGACAPKADPNAVADATAARGPDTEEAAAALMRGGQTVGYTGEDDIVAGYPEPPRPSRDTASEPKKAPAAADDDRADPVALTPGESAPVRRTATRSRSAPRKVAEPGDATGRSESDEPPSAAGGTKASASSSAARRRPRLRPVPVDLAAAPLFGMWRVDTERSDPSIATYERIWFSPDGRCRGWSNGTSANATWTWQPKEGVIVVGLDSMGSEFPTFTWLGGTLELVDIEDRKIVLVPDRLFVKPAPVRGAS